MRGPIFFLFLLLAGAGAYNYHQNARLDAELANRPHAGMSDRDLSTLVLAYRVDVAEGERLLGEVPDSSDRLRGFKPSEVENRVRAFEEFQKDAASWKDRKRETLERRMRLEELQHEQGIRAQGLHQPWWRLWRRVSTINL